MQLEVHSGEPVQPSTSPNDLVVKYNLLVLPGTEPVPAEKDFVKQSLMHS